MSDLLSKIKKTLGTGVDVIGTKSKELWDSTVIRTRIAELRSRRRGLAEQLGSMVYTMLAEDSLDLEAIKAKATEIAEVDVEIDRAEEELARVGREVREAQENKTEQAETKAAQTEKADGGEIEPAATQQPQESQEAQASQASQEPQEPPVAARRCECGAKALAGARYCVECGRPIPPEPAP